MSAPPSLDGVWASASVTWPVTSTVTHALRGAIAGSTEVIGHDPATGRVWLRGHVLADLREIEADALAFLLAHGERPRDLPEHDLRWALVREELHTAMRLPPELHEWLATTPASASPAGLMLTALSWLGCHVEHQHMPADAAALDLLAPMRLLGHVLGLAIALGRRQRGMPLVQPVAPTLTLSARLLAETRNAAAYDPPSPAHVAALDDLILACADLGLTPGTLAGLTVASCEADWHTSACAALAGWTAELRAVAAAEVGASAAPARSALGVPGEAPSGPASAARAAPEALPDDRRDLLRQVVHAVDPSGDATPADHSTLELAWQVLRRLGVEPLMIPCVLAVVRASGFLARVAEQRRDNRIMRPLARYVGPAVRPVPPRGAAGATLA